MQWRFPVEDTGRGNLYSTRRRDSVRFITQFFPEPRPPAMSIFRVCNLLIKFRTFCVDGSYDRAGGREKGWAEDINVDT